MKKVSFLCKVIFLLITCFSAYVNAVEKTVLWHNSYGSPYDYDRMFYAYPTKDGGIITVGETETMSHGVERETWIQKLSSGGDTVWNKAHSYQRLSEYWGFGQDSSDGLWIAAGYNLFRYGPNGDSLLVRSFYPSYKDGYPLRLGSVVANDGGALLTGSHWYNERKAKLFISQFDSEGAIIWERFYGDTAGPGYSKTSGYENVGRRLILLPDNYSICVGFKGAYTRQLLGGSIWILKFNNKGDTLWTKTYRVVKNIERFYQVHHNKFIVMGYTDMGETYFLCINGTGDFLWEKFHQKNIWDACVLPNGNLLTIDNDEDELYCISAKTGDSLWTVPFEISSWGKEAEYMSLILCPDNTIIYCGNEWGRAGQNDNGRVDVIVGRMKIDGMMHIEENNIANSRLKLNQKQSEYIFDLQGRRLMSTGPAEVFGSNLYVRKSGSILEISGRK